MTLVYNPRPAFIPFHNRPQRWATLVTHRRAGKTLAVINDLILAARTPLGNHKPDPQYAYLGPTYRQAKRVAWRYLKNYSRPYWTAPPSESELRVTLTGNATVYVLGADNADSLRGMYLDGAMCDEYAMWKPSVFSEVLRPALSDRNGWGVFASTPRGKNLFHEQYLKARKDPLRHFLLNLRADTSGLVPPQELIDLRADMDPETFAQEYLCSFDAALKGAIYANEVNNLMLTERVIGLDLYDPHLPCHFVYDLGFTDSTVRIAFQLPPLTGRVNIVNVLAKAGVTIFEHIDDLYAFGGPVGTVWLPPDAKARNLQTGKSIVEQFLEHDITPRMVPAHHVHDGIAATRRLFPRIYVSNPPLDPNDPEGGGAGDDLIEAMKQYHREWDDDLLTFKDQPVHDWSSDYMDALRYMAVAVNIDAPGLFSSDNALQSRLSTPTPSIGYNLETLHADRGALRTRNMP